MQKIGQIRIQFFLPVNLRIQLKEAAAHHNISCSEFIRQAIAEKLTADRRGDTNESL